LYVFSGDQELLSKMLFPVSHYTSSETWITV